MSHRQHNSLIFSGLLTILFCLSLLTETKAQDTNIPAPMTNSREVRYFYVHAMIGLSFDVYKSSDIEAMVPEELNVHSLGFPFQYGIHGGFRNIAQIEYCVYNTSAHNIGTGGFVNGQIVAISVPMKLKAKDILFKLNPAVWTWGKSTNGAPANCFFVVVGTGDVTYKDDVGDGFEGSGPLYGLEWNTISRYGTLSFGFTHQSITYDTVRIFEVDTPDDVKSSRFMMYARLSLGYGL